ncbi:MAG: YkgJ family cysteine cluster protein [Candidatus Zixiibacteriota bacterium]|nr:MAG: YkgJ family cysteine cluster protein [candidate division Zixibacteria bacterium]
MDALERFKQTILAEYPRLAENDTFRFACRPGVPCFNACCADVNIFLTPYDILRLKNRLGLTSDEFLQKYTLVPIEEHQQYPVILLKMQDNEAKTCHFVTEKGCSVYEDRPWACRYYPLGLASPREGEGGNEEFFFLLHEEVCRGFEEQDEWTVARWREDQGVTPYDEFGRLFKDLTLHSYFRAQKQLDAGRMELFHMACYDLDTFRRFIRESTFLQRFDLEPGQEERIMADDEELLRFGFRWLLFALFGDKTIKVKPSALRG